MPADPLPTAEPFSTTPSRRRRGAAGWWLVGALIAFALGLAAMYAAMPWIERWRTPAAPAPVAPVTVSSNAAAVASPATLDALSGRVAMLDMQLRQIEGRATGIDAASRTAGGYATRAEALMIAFAARRALDRGLGLGYLEPELRERFGTSEPRAVATIVQAARQPTTREDLRLALDTIAPRLTVGSVDDGILRTVGRELSNLIVLRHVTAPSPRPADRLLRARRMVDAGNIEAGLAEVARLPGVSAAASWTEAARRYIDAQRALDTLELAAISGRTSASIAAPAPAPAPEPAPTPSSDPLSAPGSPPNN